MKNQAQSGELPVMLELRDVSKTYHISKSESVVAVESVSFVVHEGEFVTLIGPSGCGKSTTLRMIGGFAKPSSGEVYIDGQLVNDLGPEERNIPMVFQNYALFPHLSVFENIAYGLKARKLPPDAIAHDVAMMCQMLNLVGTETRFPDELSDGQQQRVALARALVLKPKIILFDEPLSNLDARLRIQTRAEIKRMQRILNITVLYVTHDQAEALGSPNRVIVMNKGRVIQEGKPRDVYDHPKTPFVADFIGNANFYDAYVISVGTETMLISLQELEFSVPLENCDHIPERDDVVLVAINPITIALRPSDGAGADGCCEGTIQHSIFAGHSIEYTVGFGSTTIRVVQPNIQGEALQHEVGSTVCLTLNPATFRLFEAYS